MSAFQLLASLAARAALTLTCCRRSAWRALDPAAAASPARLQAPPPTRLYAYPGNPLFAAAAQLKAQGASAHAAEL